MQIQSLSTYSVFGTENVSLKYKESLNPSEFANPHIDPAPKCHNTLSIDHRKEGYDTARIGEANLGARALILKAVACRMPQREHVAQPKTRFHKCEWEDQVLPILAGQEWPWLGVIMHYVFLPHSFLTKTPSCLKSPDFQSLRSPCSIVRVVATCQQSSVWSVKRTLIYKRPSSNVCSTQSTTFPRRPGYLRPGSKVSRLGRLGVRFLMLEILVSRR